MARTPTAGVALAETVVINAEQLAAGQSYMAEHSQLIMDQFGDGQAYERARFVDRARFHMARSAEEALAVGRCLIVMKENEPHGEWLNILEQLGLDDRLAQRMAKAALKFGGADTPQKVLEAAKSKSKLFELMVLDDDDLEALNEGNSVAGLTLDDIDRMTVRDLRKALRDARDDSSAQRQILADKNARIDELQTKLAKKPLVVVLPPDEEAQQLRLEASGFAIEVEGLVATRLKPAVEALIEHEHKTGIDHTTDIANMLEQVERAIGNLREQYGITQRPALPAWMSDDADAVVAAAIGQEQ